MESDAQLGSRPSVTGVRLIGRARECAAVDGLIDAIRKGGSASLMVTGEPGIGKSSLLAYGVQAAGADTMVLTAKGIRAEEDIPFAALAQLLGRLAWQDMDLPQPQRTALEVAFAITDAPMLGDRLAVGAGVLNVLAAAALERPILVVVDDMQWIDDPSASALIFAARRLEHDRVGFLLSYRDSDASELPDLPQLHLEGLDAAATAHLLATRNVKLTTRQVAGLVRLSGGNPLALVDLPDLMTGERLAELDFDAGPLPLGTVLETAYAQKIDQLLDTARRGLLVAALIHGSDPQALRAALAAADVDVSALEGRGGCPPDLRRPVRGHLSAPADQISHGAAGGQFRSTAGARMDRRRQGTQRCRSRRGDSAGDNVDAAPQGARLCSWFPMRFLRPWEG
jgi:AAA ATPase-like protein